MFATYAFIAFMHPMFEMIIIEYAGSKHLCLLAQKVCLCVRCANQAAGIARTAQKDW